jgi:hypothetical protein
MMSDLRKDFHQAYLHALFEQSHANWTAFLLGEKEGVEGNIHYIKCEGTSKEDKLVEAARLLNSMPVKPEFIVRLDDDDLIGKDTLQTVEKNKNTYDVFTDRYQYMFDSYSGKILSKVYPWWPSTLVMKYSDAVALQPAFGNRPLFACPHDLALHPYFKGRKVFYFERMQPGYVRIFSPVSQSFRLYNGELNIEKYRAYVNGYGFWSYAMSALSQKLRKHYAPLATKYYGTQYKDISFLFNVPLYLYAKANAFFKKVIRKAKRTIKN